jgi:hypothetical protein
MTRTNFAGSMQLIRYLLSDEGQQLFANYGVSSFGQSLFQPYIPLVKSQSNQTLLEWIKTYAILQGSECPPQFRYQADDLYSTLQVIAPQLSVSPQWNMERKRAYWIPLLKA